MSSCLDAALVLSCLRTQGSDITARVEVEVGRRLQGGWPALPDSHDAPTSAAMRCAVVQAGFDRRAGLTPALHNEPGSGRAWLVYRPPHRFEIGAGAPSAALGTLPGLVSRAWFQGRHATTASRYGSSGTQFVHTHDMTDGDPVDAGYYVTDEIVAGSDPRVAAARYVRSTAEPIPLPAGVPHAQGADDPTPVTTEQGAASSWMRATVLTETLGEVDGDAVAAHGWHIALGAFWHQLPAWGGLRAVSSPEDAARVYTAVMSAFGVPGEVTHLGDHVVVRHEPGLPSTGTRRLRSVLLPVVNAWSAILPNHGWTLRCLVLPDTAAPPTTDVLVRFDSLGPG